MAIKYNDLNKRLNSIQKKVKNESGTIFQSSLDLDVYVEANLVQIESKISEVELYLRAEGIKV